MRLEPTILRRGSRLIIRGGVGFLKNEQADERCDAGLVNEGEAGVMRELEPGNAGIEVYKLGTKREKIREVAKMLDKNQAAVAGESAGEFGEKSMAVGGKADFMGGKDGEGDVDGIGFDGQ